VVIVPRREVEVKRFCVSFLKDDECHAQVVVNAENHEEAKGKAVMVLAPVLRGLGRGVTVECVEKENKVKVS